MADSIIRASLPDDDKEPELQELVKTCQILRHSKTCRKYRNEKRRFHFSKSFADHTIIAEPFPNNMSDQTKKKKIKNKNQLLKNFKTYINTELNLSKRNFKKWL